MTLGKLIGGGGKGCVIVQNLVLLTLLLVFEAKGCEYCDENNPGITAYDEYCAEIIGKSFSPTDINKGGPGFADYKKFAKATAKVKLCEAACMYDCKDICSYEISRGIVLKCPITTTLIIIIVVVVVIVLGSLIGIAVFLCMRKRRRGAEYGGVPGGAPGSLAATLDTVQSHRSQLGYGTSGPVIGGMSSMVQNKQFNRMQNRPQAQPQSQDEDQTVSA